MKIKKITLTLVSTIIGLCILGCSSGQEEPLVANDQDFIQEKAQEDLDKALLTALDTSSSLEYVLQLLKDGADANAKDERGNAALIKAVANNLPKVVKLLVTAGADVNIQNQEGKSALMLAIEKGYTEIVKLLLAAEADFSYEKGVGLAEKQGQKEIWELLIFNDSPIMLEREGVFNTSQEMEEYIKGCANEPDKVGRTPLYWAIKEGNSKEVQTLIEEGADVNFVNQFQDSILMLAVKRNQLEIAKILIRAGADVNYTNDFGKGALQIAEQKGFTEIADLLRVLRTQE